MAKNSIDAYGALGKTNLLFFDPDQLVLVTDPASPLYDPCVDLPVNEDLARNIDFHGVLQPISVVKNTETGETEVAVGRQRVKAARLVQVPGQVYRGERRTALTEIISENELREPDTPLGRAEKMRRAMAFGYGESDVGMFFGCSSATVRATVALLDCCADVRNAVESERINVTHARQLSKLRPEEQREKVRELVAAGANVAGHARARAQRKVLGEHTPRMRSRKQIAQELDASTGERAETLRWVLNLEREGGECRHRLIARFLQGAVYSIAPTVRRGQDNNMRGHP